MTAPEAGERQRLRDVIPWRHGEGLPPGQRELAVFPRFSDQPLRRPPSVPSDSALVVAGAVDRELHLPVQKLVAEGDRTEVTADFHCVTTWSVRHLQWSGLSFATFWHQVVVPQCAPAADARCVVVEGRDGARAVLLLADALASDVVLADRLDGEPLDLAHGAPLRLVSPRQYGYKSIKHLRRIEVHLSPPPSRYGPKEHLRARVALEERHSSIGPRLLRWVYRPLVPVTALAGERSLRQGPR